MKIKGKTILGIGGAGFIGSHVVDLLLKEDVGKVIIYDNFSRGTIENLKEALKDPRCIIFDIGGDILQTDILDEAVKLSDAVIHLAAVWLLQCQDFPRTAFDVNIRGTFNVLESCVKNNIERLIYSSSSSVYGNAIKKPMNEDHPYNNHTFYGATKIAGEHMFKSFHRRYGLKGVALRFMNVYGPRQLYNSVYTSVIIRVLDNIKKGISPIVYGDGSQSFDFTNVLDTSRSNIVALKSDVPFGFYNVGRGVGTSIKSLVEMILRISKSDLEIEYKEVEEEFVTNRLCDPTKTAKDLSFTCEIELEDGLQDLIEWRNNNI